ncbi:hypothetical protein, partial [Propioniciclava sp.]|uniref:hypothetical protein n=1 Tax=Propioniciclava sp. TaxID=2038686 RepID=UPI0026365331
MRINRSTAAWAVASALGLTVLGGTAIATAETATPSPQATSSASPSTESSSPSVSPSAAPT